VGLIALSVLPRAGASTQLLVATSLGFMLVLTALAVALRAQLLTNEHSPAKYRVNGVVRNVDPWYKAFNVQPGDKLYLPPEQRVHVW